jgi:tRNA (cmo5U34)-methyltransferase
VNATLTARASYSVSQPAVPGAAAAPAAGPVDQDAAVADDTIAERMPQYWAMQYLAAKLALRFGGDGIICDIGCGAGHSLKLLLESATRPIRYVGIDSSPALLARCEQQVSPHRAKHDLRFQVRSAFDEEFLPASGCRVVLMIFVLQFLRPVQRHRIIQMLRERLEPGGCLLLVEQTVQDDVVLRAAYDDVRRTFELDRGQAQAPQALLRTPPDEHMIPYYPAEQLAMLGDAGFTSTTTFFQWLDFQGYLAVK